MMIERCVDSGCGYDNRLDYCEQEANQADGPALVVLEALNELLYENEGIQSDYYHLNVNAEGQLMERTFSVWHTDIDSWIWPVMETKIALSHYREKRPSRDMYRIEVAWNVHQQGSEGASHVVRYSIDAYQSGALQAIVELPNLAENKRETKAMTTYDYESLFNDLALIDFAQSAERHDNELVNVTSHLIHEQ